MLARAFRSFTVKSIPSNRLSSANPSPKSIKDHSLSKRAPRTSPFIRPIDRPNYYKSYCTKATEIDDNVDVTLEGPDNPRLTHKQAANMLEENGLIKNDTAFKIFSSTDPVLFSFTGPTEEAGEGEETDDSRRERAELYMDNWLHSALTVIGTVSVLDEVLKPGARVLDLACGNGYMTVILAKMVSPGGRVLGIDHSIEKLEAAQKTIGEHFPEVISTVKLMEGDVFKDIPRDKKFNAIHVSGGVQEVPQEWLDMLLPDGCLIAATPEIEPTTGETQFMLRKYHMRKDGAVLPINMMFVNYEELVEPKL